MERQSLYQATMLPDKSDCSFNPQRFAHQAMATVFEIYCMHEDRRYAEQAAQAAFDLVDRLETELTCHRENSDISRINNLQPGEIAVVGSWTMECLQLAQHFFYQSNGAFDISLGSGIDAMELIPEDFSVRRHSDKMQLDLGGIGKGYAVDRAGELLEEWEVCQSLLHAGFSSVLALDAPPQHDGWSMTISLPASKSTPSSVLARFVGRRQAWSASGTQKKDHIINPKTGLPVRNRPAVWVSGSLVALCAACVPEKTGEDSSNLADGLAVADSPAAAAEALSTAFMILSPEEIAEYCQKHAGIEVWLLTPHPTDASAPPSLLHYPQ
jgi:thiamine biosynthesis lipoprotein